MANGNPSGFGQEFRESSQDSAEAQFIPENICGEGAGCKVYRIRLDGLLVAVKRLSEAQRLNATFVAAYRKEFEIGRRLRHDALPVYHGLRADTEEVYIVMDFVDGVTVEDYLDTAEGKAYLSDGENLGKFLSQVLDAVAYLHRSGVVHCDLKPSNIMLRRSDSSAMIIDLDKAYRDTHDLTHGGTPGISDAIPGHEKPDAGKDLAALGRILDVIMSRTGNAASRKFRRFRKLCDAPDISAAKLRAALPTPAKPAKTAAIWIVALVNLTFIGMALFYYGHKETADTQELPVRDTTEQISHDSIGTGMSRNETASRTAAAKESHTATAEKGDEIREFDSRMAKYIKETESATAALRSGKLTDTEIQNLASRVSDLYLSASDEIKEDYRKRFPAASESDVYLALTKALGSSRTFQIMQSFNKELMDTVNARLAKLDASRK